MMILAPFGAMLVQMAISRTREYDADDLGARICGQPMWLASALSKIDRRRASGPEPGRRAQSGDGAHVHHQPAVGSRHGQSVLDPPVDREPHRRVAAARGGNGRAGWTAFRQRPRQLSAPQPVGPALGLTRTVGINSQKRSPGERSDPGAGVPACRWRSCGLRFRDKPTCGQITSDFPKWCQPWDSKIFRFRSYPNQSHNAARLTTDEGRSRSSRTCGEMRWTRMAR